MEAPLTPRRVAGLLTTPGCERRSRLVVGGVDLDALAVRLGGEQVGQSPFALARSAQFEARLQAGGYAELLGLIREKLGVAVTGVREPADLAACLTDPEPALHVLGPQRLPWAGGVLDVESLMVVSGEQVHLVGVRTYAMLGEVADPAKVAATSRELAVEIVALRQALADPMRASTRTLLVLPRNFGLTPTAAVLDVAPQVVRVNGLRAALDWHARAAEVDELTPKFGDGCPQCPLMARCAGELERGRSVARLGSAVASMVDAPTVDDALVDPPPDQLVRMRLRAARTRQAARRATVRHAHMADGPLVVTGYHLAGEPAAVVALHYGTSEADGRLLVASEPRDREQRMALLREFSADLNTYVAGFEAVEPVVRRDFSVVECRVDAPQLVTPNGATAQWLTDVLGRYLRASGDAACEVAGRHLGWLAGRRVLPGASTVLTATGLLTAHWVTGQLPAEDVHLPSLLSWIEPAGDWADLPAGPISDPRWDVEHLAPALGDPTAVRAAVAARLEAAWHQTWQALELVRRELPDAGAHVSQRWERDRWSFTAHLARMREGTAEFAARLNGVPAYRFLHELETRTVALERQMALDDPLIMAGYQISGDALTGVVAKVDREHTLASASGRDLLRPRIWLSTEAEFGRPLGTRLWLASDPKIMVTVTAVEPGGVELVVQKGAVQRAALQRLPHVGDEIVFSPFGAEDVFPSRLPEQLPWQFGADPGGEGADE